MKKFLFLVIVILALFTIDHPLIKGPREKLLSEGVGIISNASHINRGPAATMARNKIKSTMTLSESEADYLEESMQTDDQLQLFHTRYCQGNDLNIYFYEERLNTVCKIVTESLSQRRGK